MAGPITDINQLDLDGTYTVADYLTWQFDEMVQLIKGKIVRMSPAPRDIHAQISDSMLRALHKQIPGRSPCQIRYAPYDVYLPVPNRKRNKPDTVVQPDLLIVCDPDKIQSKGCVGAPNWICEIVSLGSYKLDTITKRDLYAEAGVPEYCLVFPELRVLQVYRLQNGKYGDPDIYNMQGQQLVVSSVEGVVLEYDELFPPEPLPDFAL